MPSRSPKVDRTDGVVDDRNDGRPCDRTKFWMSRFSVPQQPVRSALRMPSRRRRFVQVLDAGLLARAARRTSSMASLDNNVRGSFRGFIVVAAQAPKRSRPAGGIEGRSEAIAPG